MRVDVRDPKLFAEEWYGVQAFDFYTGKKIQMCFLADDETGEWGAFALDKNGCPYLNEERTEIVRVYGKCERLKLVFPIGVSNPKRM